LSVIKGTFAGCYLSVVKGIVFHRSVFNIISRGLPWCTTIYSLTKER